MAVDYDVGIIGGGPAGSAMAAYLARAGVRCVVLEAAHFPRPHVGESLVPAATRIFKEIGFIDRMEQLGFVRKYGASWSRAGAKTRHHHLGWEELDDDCHAAVRFGERAQPGVAQNYTWHVDRGRFDLALLEHAEACGAAVRQGVRVTGVDFDASDPVIRLADGDLRVRMVADASGRRTLIGRQLGLLRRDPLFDQYAVHSWYRGFDRSLSAEPDNIHIHFLPREGSWVWQIPISEDVTSLGVVTQKAHFKVYAGAPRDALFERCLQAVPALRNALRGAERVRPICEEADYSYAMTDFAGDRWLLLGDAARFVDPIFSSGVSIALSSAKFGSRDVVAALESGPLCRARLSRFEQLMQRGVRNWYDFICLYYRLNVLFTHFINDPAHRLDLLGLLQGDVYDEERPAVLERMRDKIAQVEANPQHMWHGLLGELRPRGLATAAG